MDFRRTSPITKIAAIIVGQPALQWVAALHGAPPEGSDAMPTSPLRVERRVGQRFPYLLPLCFRQLSGFVEGAGFTQDLSSRGVFFFADAPLTEGAEIEVTLRMPSEITLGKSMPVRCRGRILRVVRPVAPAYGLTPVLAETKIGVAVRLECYEYLPDAHPESTARVSSLHTHREEEQRLSDPSIRP